MSSSRRRSAVEPVRRLPFIVIRLAEVTPTGNDLRAIARKAGFQGLARLLDEHREITAERAIRAVTPTRLLALEQKARGSDFPPLWSLTSFWRLDCRRVPELVDKLVAQLSKLPEVAVAYRQAPGSAPTPVTNPSSNPLFSSQGYLAAAPAGIGTAAAWAVADGAGIGFCDVEQSWLVGHEDLFPSGGGGPSPTILLGNDTTLLAKAHHGAAVLGVVVARANGIGVVGIAPGVTSIWLSSHGAVLDVADAILEAVAQPGRVRTGDVLLLEVQKDANKGTPPVKWAPTEFENLDFTAIRLASALGVIVVEAAGNGVNMGGTFTGFDLATLAQFNPTSASFQGDSGAIIVAAAGSAVPHAKTTSSNFGARVDCYAWGANVTTASGDDAAGGEIKGDGTPASSTTPDTQRYTRQFGGTSAASAIVAGAAILVQDVYRLGSPARPAGGRLSPRQMRRLLKANGTAPSSSAQNIGVMPDLGLLVPVLNSTPDLYLRDDIGDDGSVPSAGAVSVSPDVVVSATNVSAAAAFAAGSTNVELGQDNFVYVRVSNRNATPANGATVRVFWSAPSTLITPSSWKPLNPGASPPPPPDGPPDATLNVPGSTVLVAAPTITWQQANLPPAQGHYCFIATVDHSSDPQPPGASFTWDQFVAYVRNNNNVTWRNFDVVDDVPLAPGPGKGDAGEAPFFVSGAPDKLRIFTLEILQTAPAAASIGWELPLTLFDQLPRKNFVKVDIDKRRSRALAVLRPDKRLSFADVRLNKNARHRCRFLAVGTKLLPRTRCVVAIRQIFETTEVGRVTWEFRAAR